MDVTDGLSQNTVNDIFQDSDGYLWVATQDGLNRYDGYEIKQYLPQQSDSSSISDNFLWNITEDRAGYLWVCSRNAVNKLDKRTGIFTKYMTDPGQSPTSIVHRENETLILVGINIYRIPYNQDIPNVRDSLNVFSKINLDVGHSAIPFGITLESEDRIAVYSQKGVTLISGEDQKLIEFGFDPGTFVTMDNKITRFDSRVIIGTAEGLYNVDLAAQKISPYLQHLYKGTVHSVNPGPSGKLWLSTDRGIQILDIDKNSIEPFRPMGDQSDILTSEVVFSIHQSTNGILWIGTSNNGLYSYDHDQDKFKFLNAQNDLTSSMIWSINQVSENEYWLGTELGVTILKKKPNTAFTGTTFLEESISEISSLKLPGLSSQRVNNIFVDGKGNKWLSVQEQGVWVLDEQNRLLKKISFNQGDPISNQVSSVISLGEKYWVTTFNGIYEVSEDLLVIRRLEHAVLNTGYFFKGIADSNQHLWFGSNTGFFKYDPNDDNLTHYPYDAATAESPGFYFVNDFAETRLGNLWLATFGGGFDHFNKTTGEYKHFTQEEGLANNVVSSIMTDRKHNLWLGTNRGISRYSPTDSIIVNFNLSDGIIFDETAINSSYQNESGEMFFGTPGGLIVFHPDSISHSTDINKPELTGFLVNYEDSKASRIQNETIHLFPKDKVITFEFASLVFRNAERTTYEFMIDDIDDNWVKTDANNRRATYSTLPYGTHEFKVRARNTYGNVSEEKRIIIVVHPPIWLTWWFLTLISIALLSIILASVRAYFKHKMNLNLREMEVKQRLQAERERISRDLHDNVGSQITHIISSLDNMAYQAEKKKTIGDKLDDLSDFARSTMRFLRETIWVINKDAISLGEFVDKSSDYGKRMTEELQTSFEFKFQGNNDYLLNPSMAMNLFRVFQEGVNNAIKHANATSIIVTLKKLDGALQLSISDDGIGFNGKEKRGHYGLRNMSDRMKEMNGSLSVTNPKKGTVLRAQFPYEKTTSNA